MNLKRRAYWAAILFLIPAAAIFILFFYVPFVQSIYYSFTDWSGMGEPTFIGFANYAHIWKDPHMTDGLWNSLKMAAFGLVVQNPLALLVAVLLNRQFRTRAFIRTAFYLPVIISLVVASVVWGQMLQYDGLINEMLGRLGLEAITEDWLGNVRTSFPAIILLTQWQAIGYCAIIYLAGLQAIPQDMYEAAEIEGARGWSLFRHITLPMLMPAVTIVLFLTVVGALKLFDLPYILTNGGPGTSSYTLFLAVYNAAFRDNNYGYATAGGIVLAIFIVVISIAQLSATRRKEVEL
ncbi:carbohydrate ABC transporter permease [Paenibacillus sp. GCM10027626]|uniref:carbohydrate ABC transporter permease n=1 Tax=Paenibacillus sp. GCM10027626 TaxID=3273411 RepID=UPI00364422AD